MPHGRADRTPASRLGALSALLVGGLLFGCGARAILEEAEDDAEGSAGRAGEVGVGGTGSSRPAGSGGTGAPNNPRPTDPIILDPERLPTCVPGARVPGGRGQECTFTHDRRCYEEQAMACACACPRGGLCIIGGFPSPEEPVPVSCVQ
jgi:hypothetical protein